MAFHILGDAPTIVGPLRRRWLLIVLQVEWNQVVESCAIVIPQSTGATEPYTTLSVFVDALHRSICDAIILQMAELCPVVPADPVYCTEPQATPGYPGR